MGRIFIECLDRKLKLRKVAKAVYKTLGQISRFKVELVFQDGEDMHNLNKIVQEFNSLNPNVGFGGLACISTQINTYFTYPPTRSEWQINLYNVIKDSYNDYLILLKHAIYAINTCENNTFKPMEWSSCK